MSITNGTDSNSNFSLHLNEYANIVSNIRSSNYKYRGLGCFACFWATIFMFMVEINIFKNNKRGMNQPSLRTINNTLISLWKHFPSGPVSFFIDSPLVCEQIPEWSVCMQRCTDVLIARYAAKADHRPSSPTQSALKTTPWMSSGTGRPTPPYIYYHAGKCDDLFILIYLYIMKFKQFILTIKFS